jgi:hypothetical protein
MRYIIPILLLFSLAACHKSGTNVSGGGKGGHITLEMMPEHADDLIDTAIAYIKYGSHDAPANGIYDDSAVCVVVNGKPLAIFDSLTTGLYYVYVLGYHSWGGNPNLEGALPVTLTSQTTYLVPIKIDPTGP